MKLNTDNPKDPLWWDGEKMPEFAVSDVRIMDEGDILIDILAGTTWSVAYVTPQEAQNLDGNQDALRAVARLWAARHDVEITFVDEQARVV